MAVMVFLGMTSVDADVKTTAVMRARRTRWRRMLGVEATHNKLIVRGEFPGGVSIGPGRVNGSNAGRAIPALDHKETKIKGKKQTKVKEK